MNAFDTYLSKKANNFDNIDVNRSSSRNAEVIEVSDDDNDDDNDDDVMFLNESRPSTSSNAISPSTNNRKRNLAQSHLGQMEVKYNGNSYGMLFLKERGPIKAETHHHHKVLIKGENSIKT